MFERPIIICLILGTIITLALYLLNWQYRAASFAMGAAGSIVYLFLLRIQAKKLLNIQPRSVIKKAMGGIFIRYLFLIALIVLSVRIRRIDVLYILAGLLLIPVSAFLAGWGAKAR